MLWSTSLWTNWFTDAEGLETDKSYWYLEHQLSSSSIIPRFCGSHLKSFEQCIQEILDWISHFSASILFHLRFYHHNSNLVKILFFCHPNYNKVRSQKLIRLAARKWPQIHPDILFYSTRYYEILRRHNYVTPTSYLELILTFKKLLGAKRDDTLTLKNRYLTGLEKLEFAASQVSIMQQELTDLQPELIKTSAETEKLMVKIEQDTVEVEAKKEVSGKKKKMHQRLGTTL